MNNDKVTIRKLANKSDFEPGMPVFLMNGKDDNKLSCGDIVLIIDGENTFRAKLTTIFFSSIGFFEKESGEIVMYKIGEFNSKW